MLFCEAAGRRPPQRPPSFSWTTFAWLVVVGFLRFGFGSGLVSDWVRVYLLIVYSITAKQKVVVDFGFTLTKTLTVPEPVWNRS